MKVEELASLAERSRSKFERSLTEVLDSLRDIDPEVADQALYVFDNRTKTVCWLASPVRSLGGVTPLQALAEGRREDVLRVLHKSCTAFMGNVGDKIQVTKQGDEVTIKTLEMGELSRYAAERVAERGWEVATFQNVDSSDLLSFPRPA